MTESFLPAAFLAGIISACSLPIGAITALFWKPKAKMAAFLMAFGSGALLAALTIELVDEALDKGHILQLSIGCVLGGLLFIALNQLIENKGGFLRKTSTTIHFIRKRRLERLERALGHIQRIPLFSNLPSEDLHELARRLKTQEVAKGTVLFQEGDPSDRLFMVQSGEVAQVDRESGNRTKRIFVKNEAFGTLAFLTNSPSTTEAVTQADSTLWVLFREDFETGLARSSQLCEALCALLQSHKTREYLSQRHQMSDDAINQWMARVETAICGRHTVCPAMDFPVAPEKVQDYLKQCRQLPFFQNLPSEELSRVSAKFFGVHYREGHHFFRRGQPCDRLYLLETGHVFLIDLKGIGRQPAVRNAGDAFGVRAFLTGAVHGFTAVARQETQAWVLRKKDFEKLLQELPNLRRAVSNSLTSGRISDYLEVRHKFDHRKAIRWAENAEKAVGMGDLIPAAADFGQTLRKDNGAPMAIWLGMMLDGIPEALVIGASITHGNVSIALIAGLFMSNYPEALSSSVGMRQQGMSGANVVWLWTILMLLTGICSALGRIYFQGVPPTIYSFTGGIAAGSMLTMIAQTMLPEAYYKGGSIVGVSTLLGFLTAIVFSAMH